MIPDRPVILKGKALKEFEEYENRKVTKEEIEFMKECVEFYLSHLPEE